MGAAAGKQFQSEKAKHAEAVLNAVHLFEEANDPEEDSLRGGFSTDFFKKKVKLAASDAKSKGKDIDTSLAHLTDADLDMLAHYDENRKDEERRQAGITSSSMQVEEIVDDEVVNNDNGGDNIDETTSVLSYGDDEEEAAEPDELDSSDEMIENIEEVVETRPRLNSGFKVFPLDDSKEESKTHAKTPEKAKLKLDLPIARPGGSGAKHSSPSSSDNDSINSYSKNNSGNNNGKFRNNAHSNGDAGLSGKAQSKILRVKSNDQSDLSDEFSSSTPHQPSLGVIGKASSAVYPNHHNAAQSGSSHVASSSGKGSNGGGNVNNNGVLSKGVRRIRAAVSALNDGGDSDDSASQSRYNGGAHAGGARSLHQDSLYNNHQQQYKMSQLSDSETPAEHNPTNNLNNNNIITGAQANAAANANATSSAQIQQGVGRSTKSQAMKIQSKRVISVGVKPSSVVQSANNSNHNSSKNSGNHATNLDEANNLKKGSDSDTANTNTKSNTNTNDGDKYRALLDNVSVHLEGSLKQQDEASGTNTTTESHSNAAAVNGSRVPLRTKGGALKKVNKRRHSMDGLHHDDT
eukprot:gene16462-18785_t